MCPGVARWVTCVCEGLKGLFQPQPLCDSAAMQISEPQTHRMVGVGRSDRRSTTPFLEQHHLGQDAHECIQLALEISSRKGDSMTFLASLSHPVLCHSDSEVFPHADVKLAVFQVCIHCPSPITGYHRKRDCPLLDTHPPFRYLLSRLNNCRLFPPKIEVFQSLHHPVALCGTLS